MNFERQYWKTFHTKLEPSSFDFGAMDDSEKLLSGQLIFVKNLTLHSWDTQINDIWSLRKTGFAECENDFSNPQNIIMFKTNTMVQALELTESQYKVFSLLLDRRALNEALEEVEISAEEIQSLFTYMRQYSLIIDYDNY